MTDPAYLLDSSSDEFERALLGAALRDVGSLAAKARCIAAVGPTTALLATSHSGSASVLYSVLKALGMGIVLGTVASGAVIFASAERASNDLNPAKGKSAQAAVRARAASTAAVVQDSRPMPPTATTSRVPASAASHQASVSTRSELASTPQSALAPAVDAPLSHAFDSSTAETPLAHTAPLDRSLELEVQALDRARQALAAGDARRALAALDHYRRDFPNGKLLPESVLLRRKLSQLLERELPR
jgi:hypothetical protein